MNISTMNFLNHYSFLSERKLFISITFNEYVIKQKSDIKEDSI